MGVIVEKDCIVQDDGSLLCYDKQTDKFYSLVKKEVDPNDLSIVDVVGLMKKAIKLYDDSHGNQAA